MEDNPYMQERAADIRDVTKRVGSLAWCTLAKPCYDQ